MEELLNLDIFAQFLTPARIKVIVFIWNIIKCTVLLVVNVKILRFFATKILVKLNLFGIDVRPIIATAGVMGVAVGFGAKRFVEDIISGIIILIEGQVRVGDYIEVGTLSGTAISGYFMENNSRIRYLGSPQA